MGNKKALCIGIDEYHSQIGAEELNGCKNDVILWKKLLEDKFNFKVENPIFDSNATFSIIKERMRLFLEGLDEDDLGVIFFSGHGTRKYRKGKCYETICAYDRRIEGNYHLRNWIDKYKKKKARLVFIIDACESGTITELDRKALNEITELDKCCHYAIYGSYINHTLNNEQVFQIDLNDELEKLRFEIFLENKELITDFNFGITSVNDYLNMSHNNINKIDLQNRLKTLNQEPYSLGEIMELTSNKKIRYHKFSNSCNPNIGADKRVIIETKNEYEILISSCLGYQNSYEDFFKDYNQVNGVFTHLAIKNLEKESDISYNTFFNLLKEDFTHKEYLKYKQEPLLQGNNSFKKQQIFKL